MREGIDHGRNIAQEVRDLMNNRLVTMSRTEARLLIDDLPSSADDLSVALDYAQGEDRREGRYVLIYVEE
jgi:hypothetical protein